MTAELRREWGEAAWTDRPGFLLALRRRLALRRELVTKNPSVPAAAVAVFNRGTR